jgi:hypothetical protein
LKRPLLYVHVSLQAKYREALAAGLDAEAAVDASFGLVRITLDIVATQWLPAAALTPQSGIQMARSKHCQDIDTAPLTVIVSLSAGL